MYSVGIQAPDFTGMAVINAITYAQGFGNHKITTGNANAGIGCRCVDKAHRQLRLDFNAQAADGILYAGERLVIGYAQAVYIAHFCLAQFQALFYLRACAMYQNQADVEGMEQCDIMHKAFEIPVHGFAAEHQHKGRAAMRLDIGGGLADVFYEAVRRFPDFSVCHAGQITGFVP